jgi:hypothetical protein
MASVKKKALYNRESGIELIVFNITSMVKKVFTDDRRI